MNWLIRILCSFIALFVIFPTAEIEPYKVQNSDKIKMNFTVFADTHLESFTKERFTILGEALRDLDAAETKSKVLVFAGDNTMNGQVLETSLFYGLMEKYNPVENVFMACGNHDICPGKHNTGEYNDLKKRFIRYNNAFLNNKIDEMYYSKVVDGYYFIVLASDKDAGIQQFISEKQFKWFEKELQKAEKSGKPVFIFDHWPVDDVYPDVWTEGHVGPQSERLVKLMEKYNNRIFYFTGHLHMGLFDNNYHIEDRGQITYVNVPGLGVDNNVGDADHQESGMGIQVEVYENRVFLRVRNFSKHKWTDFEYNFKLDY